MKNRAVKHQQQHLHRYLQMHLRYLQERLRIRQGSCSINKGTATQCLIVYVLYACMHACMYVYVCMYVCMYACMYVCYTYTLHVVWKPTHSL